MVLLLPALHLCPVLSHYLLELLALHGLAMVLDRLSDPALFELCRLLDDVGRGVPQTLGVERSEQRRDVLGHVSEPLAMVFDLGGELHLNVEDVPTSRDETVELLADPVALGGTHIGEEVGNIFP